MYIDTTVVGPSTYWVPDQYRLSVAGNMCEPVLYMLFYDKQ